MRLIRCTDRGAPRTHLHHTASAQRSVVCFARIGRRLTENRRPRFDASNRRGRGSRVRSLAALLRVRPRPQRRSASFAPPQTPAAHPRAASVLPPERASSIEACSAQWRDTCLRKRSRSCRASPYDVFDDPSWPVRRHCSPPCTPVGGVYLVQT